VLLVDDSLEVREMVERMLLSLDVEVIVAEDGHRGLDAFLEHSPDLLISDVLMPGELSGIEFADRARANHPETPILLISGYANEVEIDYPLLPKPFALRDLERRILELLDGGDQRQTA
ncbi:MAG: response regulator, partial [Acidobacteriota bacterium]